MQTILILGGRTLTITKAKRLGLRTVLLQDKEWLLPGQVDQADAVILADYTDWAACRPLVLAAHEVYGFTQVVSLTEVAMETVGRINDLLGLGGTSYEVAHRFKNKWEMRRHMASHGIDTVAAAMADDIDAVREFGARHGYPLILKPVDGVGSRGVMRIDDPQGVESAWRHGQGLRGRDDLNMAKFCPVDRFLVEEWIPGPEFSVETFSFDGRHVAAAITEKLAPGFIEWGHVQPARLTPLDEVALVHRVAEFLDVMGLRDGVAHTEIKFPPAGPRIIESHNRVAGGRVMDLTLPCYGVDLEELAVGWPLRLVPALRERPTPTGGTCVYFLTADAGRVVSIEGVEEVRAHPGVRDVQVGVAVGDVIPETADNFDRNDIGSIVASAADATSAVELTAAMASKLSIVTVAPGEVP